MVILFPLAWLAYTSLKTTPEIFQSAWSLPHRAQWVNYRNAWFGMREEPRPGAVLPQQPLLTTISVVLILAIGSMVTYALTRFRFRGARSCC